MRGVLRSWVLAVLGVGLAGSGCSESEPAAPAEAAPAGPVVGPTESVYQRDRRVEVEIELSPGDWELLRAEGRTMAALTEEVVPDYQYTEFIGTARVDGVEFVRVGIQKKGFIGSLSMFRPSLRLDFDPTASGVAAGLRRLTLNADVQDRSHARQCMAFDLFEQAGLPASRCAFAHVTVNGADMGTYTNVEPINEVMLSRHFADDSGDLFEGTLADFDEDSWERIELETNSKSNKDELRALVAALSAPDESVVTELDSIVDLAQFRDFWAMETLLGHWDGYAEAANNYYIYFDPGRQRFVFLPWGLDQAFMGARPFGADPYEITVYARAQLARRLYDLPEQRALFRERLGELTNTLWNEQELLGRASDIQDLVPDEDPQAMAAHLLFLDNHGVELRAALAAPAPEIVDAVEPARSPCRSSSNISGAFFARWMSDAGDATIDITLDGVPIEATFSTTVQPDADASRATLNAFASLEDGRGLVVLLLLPTAGVKRGPLPFHSFETFGLVGLTDPSGPFTTLGVFGDGRIQFEQAAPSADAPVAGNFAAVFYQQTCMAGVGGG
jgi:hypothetical protein